MRRKTVLLGLGLALILAAATYVAANRATAGFVNYMAWKTFSTDAGGGHYAEIDGSRIYYEFHGTGESLLLLHGGLSSTDTFYKQLPELARHYRVLVADRRGHGRSNDTDAPFRYEDMADNTLRLLDELGIDKTHVFGWSDGGVVGLDLAMKRPDRISKLAIFGSNFHYEGLIPDEMSSPDYPADSEALAPVREIYESASPHPEQWATFVKKTLTMWSSQPEYVVEDLGSIAAPTLVMVGEHDMIQPSHTKALVDAIPNATLQILPGATHFAPIEEPEVVNRSLLAFLKD